MTKTKGRIPQTSPTSPSRKHSRLDEIVLDLIYYMELAKGTRAYLALSKALPPVLDIKLQVEANFCYNLLVRIFRVNPPFIAQVVQKIHSEKDRFRKEVEQFAEALVPGVTRTIHLFTDADFRNEIKRQERMHQREKVLKKGGNLIIRG